MKPLPARYACGRRLHFEPSAGAAAAPGLPDPAAAPEAGRLRLESNSTAASAGDGLCSRPGLACVAALWTQRSNARGTVLQNRHLMAHKNPGNRSPAAEVTSDRFPAVGSMYRLLWSLIEIQNKPARLQAPQLYVLSALGKSKTDGGAWTLFVS